MASALIPVDPMEVAFHEAAVSASCQDVRGWTLIHTNILRPDLLAMSNIWESPGEEATFVAAAKARLRQLAACAGWIGKVRLGSRLRLPPWQSAACGSLAWRPDASRARQGEGSSRAQL